MIQVFRASTRLEAWVAAVEYLLGQKGKFDLNVVLDIEQPTVATPKDRALSARLDEHYRERDMYPIHTVAETIFPGWQYRRNGLDGVFRQYIDEYQLMKPGTPDSWGTYAHRLVRREGKDGKPINPLENLITKMRAQHEREQGGKFRSFYEISAVDVAQDIPLLDSGKDTIKPRRMPCMSHLSFKLVAGQVHLTAMFRYHDYRFKVPGNLLGLARLQACVAQEVGAVTGELTVVSTFASIDATAGQREFANLLKAA